LWTPPWLSIEPSAYQLAKHPEYGDDAEGKLLAGILGHNLCLDLFGPPSPDEAQAGVSVHGEAGLASYEVLPHDGGLIAKCRLPLAQLAFERRVSLEGRKILIGETVENLSVFDRPIAWTQHVTLGPPFLERGVTQFRAPATKSRLLGSEVDFDWPYPPGAAGTRKDLRLFPATAPSSGYTAQLLDPQRERAWFFAFSPRSETLFGYVWRRNDYPWLGIWEENCSRAHAPWNGRTIALGMEFGVSPFPESRRDMIERGKLFDTPCYRWIPARSRLHVTYYAGIRKAQAIAETLEEFEEGMC